MITKEKYDDVDPRDLKVMSSHLEEFHRVYKPNNLQNEEVEGNETWPFSTIAEALWVKFTESMKEKLVPFEEKKHLSESSYTLEVFCDDLISLKNISQKLQTFKPFKD